MLMIRWNPMKKQILVIEDDPDIVEAIRYNLEKEKGFSVLAAEDGDKGMNLAVENPPDLIILDIGLPGLNGYEVCHGLRRKERTKDIPILMLTARGTESDKVMGLEMGADDYITKPFGVRELMARIRAALRRKQSKIEEPEFYDDGALYLHFQDYIIRFQGRQPQLTFKEFQVLKLLVQNAGRVLSRDRILDSVWGHNYYGEARTVDVHIRRIRKKMGNGFDQFLTTVIGAGYRFRPPEASLRD